MPFILADGTAIRSSYRYAYLVAHYADAILRVISGESWVPGVSKRTLPVQARTMFHHAIKVLDSAEVVSAPDTFTVERPFVPEDEFDIISV